MDVIFTKYQQTCPQIKCGICHHINMCCFSVSLGYVVVPNEQLFAQPARNWIVIIPTSVQQSTFITTKQYHALLFMAVLYLKKTDMQVVFHSSICKKERKFVHSERNGVDGENPLLTFIQSFTFKQYKKYPFILHVYVSLVPITVQKNPMIY